LERHPASEFVHRSPDGTESEKEEFLLNISAMPVDVVSIRGEHQKVNICTGRASSELFIIGDRRSVRGV